MSFSANSSRDPSDDVNCFDPLPSHQANAPSQESVGACLGPDAKDVSTNIEPAGDSFEPEAPPGNRMRCVVEDGQLLIGIPSGSNELVRWIGVLAIVLLATDGALTYYFVTQNELGITQVAILIAGWASFLSVLGHWICARFKTTIVLIDPDHVVEKSLLFGIIWYKAYALASFSKARLVIAHARNDEPIYAVSIAAIDERPQFGAFLRQKEKEWLVRRINRFLGRDDGLVFGSYVDPNPTGAQWELMGGFEFFDE